RLAVSGLPAEAHAAGSQRNPPEHRVRPGPGDRLRAVDRPEGLREDPALAGELLLRPGPSVPARLRAVGRGFLLALPRRGRPDAPRGRAARGRLVAQALLPAGHGA